MSVVCFTEITMLDWAHTGVNITVSGNGGPECTEFLSIPKRLLETVLVMCLIVPLMKWGFKNLSPLPASQLSTVDPFGKRLLLVLMALIFGIEIGFKFSSKTVIFLLNPCHITTALQVIKQLNFNELDTFKLFIIF